MSVSFFLERRGGAGEIRGKQMATALGGRINPSAGYEDDLCIYVLGNYPRHTPEPRRSVYDVLDCGLSRLAFIRRRTTGTILAAGAWQRQELERTFPGRRIVEIPQHHCNFLREQRQPGPVTRVGCIGGFSAVQWPYEAVAYALLFIVLLARPQGLLGADAEEKV